MEPRDQELSRGPKVHSPATERKLKRFRIVKLEERIAPGKTGNSNKFCTLRNCVGPTAGCL